MRRIIERFEDHVKEKRIAGALCLVQKDGKELFRGEIGYRDVAQTQPLKGNEIFRLASMTKPITAVAVLIAVERGLLDLDEPIGKYTDGFYHGGVGKMQDGAPVFEQTAREITLRDILSHSSGLGQGEIGNWQFLHKKTPENLKENVVAWQGAFLDFAPGAIHTAYGGVVPFELAARAVEKATDTPYDEFLRKEIFTPLGMKDTGYRLKGQDVPRLAEMFQASADGGIEYVDFGLRGFDSYAEGYTGGSAGLFSTLDDYAKFADMLLTGKGILSKGSLKQIATAHHKDENFAQCWGLGVRVILRQTEYQPLPIGTFGWSGAYGTHFWCEPSTGVSAGLMLNKSDCGGSDSPFSAEFERLVQEELRKDHD